ncbi:hypothetical protein CUS95_10935 [Enterococcus faecium]|uniref:hypothetical protein n=1 Tax=Enterococcus TaxID=1350 RepID=UPI000CF2D133|nr:MULTISPECIES: hypothetical protein [Enterococcus]PQF01904.1 hypothetical protein CUS95_10935 [Enterococcus faecium]PQF20138.1 hypothetical protein CUS93_12650 [Enterococcus faecium]
MIRKMLIIFVTTIVVSSLVLTSTAIVSLASELDTTTIKPDVYKNDSYQEMEKEMASIAFKRSLETITRTNNIEQAKAFAEYFLKKYEGAEMRTSGYGERIQNGGWNIFYQTAAGKQAVRTAYNILFVQSSAGVALSGILAAITKATLLGVGVAIAALLSGMVLNTIASRSRFCRDRIDANGNRGTGRITLTEARWSATYDFRW